MAVINVRIDDDNVAFSEDLHRMQPGDWIILTACEEYPSVSGEYIAVNNNGKCQGCVLDDLIDLQCTVYCGDCIIKKKEDILEGL
jgi:hypothetical protein